MSLFGDLYVGTSGMQSSQEALNVVAHNITNTDTAGYVRQQVSYNTREYNLVTRDATGISMKQTGLGVYIAEVRQVRDRFVDASYRNQYGRQGFYDASYAAIEEVQEVLGEMDGPIFFNSMNNISTAIEELAKDPDSEVCQSMLIQYAQSFAEAARNVYTDFADYQDKLNLKVYDAVKEINNLGKKIYELNEKIRGIEAGGIENANDAKDALNQALDELSKLGNVTYDTDNYGNVLVKFENHDFVTMTRVNELGVMADEKNAGFYQVFWPDSAKQQVNDDGYLVYENNIFRGKDGLYYTIGEGGAYKRAYVSPLDVTEVYDPTTAPAFILPPDAVISASRNSDVGELKGLVLARGDHRGNYTDLQGVMKKTELDDDGNLVTTYLSYEEDFIKTLEDQGYEKKKSNTGVISYEKPGEDIRYSVVEDPEERYAKVSQSVMMNSMAEFDGLVHSVVTAINQALIDAANKASDEAAAVGSNSSYMRDAGNDPLLIFQRSSTEPEFDDSHVLVAEDPRVGYEDTLFSCMNISVNQDLLQFPTHLGLVKEDGSVDYETAAGFRNAFTNADYVLNPTLTNKISINEYYASFVAQIANSGNVYKSLKENQELTVNQIESTRQGGFGVSTDEELANMIKYQNAYNASSRFINVINECTEHIITQLGSR